MEEANKQTIPNSSSDQGKSSDIMSVFEPAGEQTNQGVTNLNEASSQGAINSAEESKANEDVDPRFAHLPKAEALARSYQSKYDKIYSEYEKTLRELDEYRNYKLLLDEVLENDEAFEAFVYARKPDLIKKQDITEIIKAQMEKEFGDYKPSRLEAEEDPGGKAWLYYKRLDELYEEYKNKKPVKAEKIEDMLKRKAEEKLQKEKALNEELNKIKNYFKWDDNQLATFANWAQKLSPLDLAKIYNFAVKTMRINAPSVANVSGGAVNSLSEREKFLMSMKKR